MGAPTPATAARRSRLDAQVASDPQIKQALPTATVDTTLPLLAGKHTAVKSGDSLQAAIDAAQPGDTLELEAGATFTGPLRRARRH